MQVQPINHNSFCAKNTFLNQAKSALSRQEKRYALSMHQEAKSRLHYIKYIKATEKLKENKTLFSKIRTLPQIIYEKLASINSQLESFHTCPERFYK